ncbi:cytochrome c biogenesis CcdA family protein [Deinococcus sp. AJ005]|uniref:cytochrome c biogenesis CcdA family protein n=1 Tax=Deinococcus sp. AJ005 TaxID=2652443 RepID=UPI00125CAC99|nr:cytochrome c biogenesis CcdA family protein [Deinococcus sp. AJ005]QFP77921.1 cytochrome c biogenesis protein CcdA [Deinococcus sp. AJ005]
MLLLLVAFAGGLLTVLSPCVLPVLPVLLSGAVGGRGRPLGIIAGFIGSFVLLTLFLATLVNVLGLSVEALRWGAVALLLLFGLTLAVPALQLRFELLAARALPQGTGKGGDGFLGGVLVGATLGVVWTPCVGPILAGVTTLALSGQVTGFAAAVTLAYALGVAIPMLGVMWGGRKLLHRPALMNRLNQIQQAFGVVLMLFAVGMVFGVDRQIQTALVDNLPALQQLTFLEETPAVQRQLEQTLP